MIQPNTTFATWFKQCGFDYHGGVNACAKELDVSRRYIRMLLDGQRKPSRVKLRGKMERIEQRLYGGFEFDHSVD